MPATTQQKCAVALSTSTDARQAAAEAARELQSRLASPPNLLAMFVSPHYGPDFAPLLASIREAFPAATLIGCTGESIVAGGREIEQMPALSLWGAALPGARLNAMHLDFAKTPEGGSIVGWPDELLADWPRDAALLVLGEPFSFPADALLERLNDDRPGMPVLGGMASGGWGPGQNRLFLDDQVLDRGAVALLVHGGVRVRSLVSQGCRPVGRHFVITKAQQNVIVELSGKPAMEQLREVYKDLTGDEQRLVRQGLHVGRVTNEYQDTFRRGDFLVRNVVGADPDSGVIAIGDFVRPGQTVQFHLRDAASADEDLRELLAIAREQGGEPVGGLLFTCNGRGTRLFDGPDHDAAAVQSQFADLPLAGLFAQGEIGPVGGKNFVHGFTASLALFEAAPE